MDAAISAERCPEPSRDPEGSCRPGGEREVVLPAVFAVAEHMYAECRHQALTWDCIRWEDGEVLVCKSLRRDGYSSGHHIWAYTKTGR